MNAKILFVDDEVNVLDSITRSLRNQFRIDTACGGREALQRLSSDGPYAVVVADMHMPEMSGLELLRRVKQQAPDAVRMMLTGNSSLKAAMAAVNEGHVFQFLTKPCPAQTLAPALDAGLQQYSRLVSQRKEVELALHGSEEQMRLILEAANDGVWEYRFAGNTLVWSGRMYEMFGCDRDAFQLTPESFLELVHPEDQGAFRLLFNPSLARNERFQVQFRTQRNGVFAHFIGRGRTVLDASRRPVRILGSTTDITNLLRAEERVSEQATLLDQAQDAILVQDLDGSVRYWNKSAERVFGWNAEDVRSRKVQEFLHDQPRLYHDALSSVLSNEAWTGEVLIRTKDNLPITIETRWTLVRDKFGLPKSILSINTDITEKKEVQAQLLRAQRMEGIGALAGGIAHDLNNVFSPIVLGIDLLRLDVTSASGLDLLEIMEASGRRGIDMVKQVLQFARGAEGRRFSIPPGKLFSEVKEITNQTFSKTIRVETSSPFDVWNLSGDPTQLHQVLLNLCVNSRDAMPNGGVIAISAENINIDEQFTAMNPSARLGPHVKIVVADTGIGMPPEILERIFDPFFTTKEVGKGTGLGLSATLAIIKNHRGFVHVESTPGHGTSFSFCLPACTENTESALPPPTRELPRGNNELILVIDDEASIRSITSQTLEAYEYRVLTARDGAEGVAVYAKRATEISAVLADMGMPIMGGEAVIRVISRLNPDAKIIAMSGLRGTGPDENAPVGAKCFLAKPYTAEALLTALHELLSPAT